MLAPTEEALAFLTCTKAELERLALMEARLAGRGACTAARRRLFPAGEAFRRNGRRWQGRGGT